jgi:hypothetical protein
MDWVGISSWVVSVVLVRLAFLVRLGSSHVQSC